ncbi:mas-related G-protein coupled receptor member H-like [Crotalus tigris]|uniref:mas-related G-protein coupled receptor member H-like n=1 Tax=Crotalus tigris TaxID=88082 RepID=UPI00192F2405|nr:mas-related G-protein coupled receptor member H-like [Crotalus tigris]
MMNSSLGDLDATENYYGYNDTIDSFEYTEEMPPSVLGWIALIGITLMACCIGFMGNGYIIWLLGFQMKRNRFTTFILHLAIADFGFLMSVVIYNIYGFIEFEGSTIFYIICAFFFQMMHFNSHFLLTAISIDRCVAVLFPIWHHCSRPKRLSSMVCVLLWIASFLLSGIMKIMTFTKVIVNDRLSVLHFLVTAIVCLPLITLSTGVLFIKPTEMDESNFLSGYLPIFEKTLDVKEQMIYNKEMEDFTPEGQADLQTPSDFLTEKKLTEEEQYLIKKDYTSS